MNDDATNEPNASAGGRLGFLATMRAVLWAFFGVRGSSGYRQDVAGLNPVHVIIAGIIAAALFVITLIVIVRIVAG